MKTRALARNVHHVDHVLDGLGISASLKLKRKQHGHKSDDDYDQRRDETCPRERAARQHEGREAGRHACFAIVAGDEAIASGRLVPNDKIVTEGQVRQTKNAWKNLKADDRTHVPLQSLGAPHVSGGRPACLTHQSPAEDSETSLPDTLRFSKPKSHSKSDAWHSHISTLLLRSNSSPLKHALVALRRVYVIFLPSRHCPLPSSEAAGVYVSKSLSDAPGLSAPSQRRLCTVEKSTCTTTPFSLRRP
jgi:hypothetical protein